MKSRGFKKSTLLERVNHPSLIIFATKGFFTLCFFRNFQIKTEKFEKSEQLDRLERQVGRGKKLEERVRDLIGRIQIYMYGRIQRS